MKRIVVASVMTLVVVTLTLPALTFAGNDGPSATGNFQFSLEDNQPRFLEFNAREQNKGQVIGEMTFSDPSVVPIGDPDAALLGPRRRVLEVPAGGGLKPIDPPR